MDIFEKTGPKVEAFFKKNPRIIYEFKSFMITFVGVYAAITGLSETTTLRAVLDNKELFIGSISIAAFRTLLIFILKVVDYDYRASTAKYK